MPKWNQQQLKAIETKQKNVLVSASAGSGKTTVLIARLMDLVMKDHVSIDAICAMTFTEAAANEMKKRLASELQHAYQNSTNDEDKAYISKQLTSIQTAHISTIHSFCLSIIQDYYYIIGLHAKRIRNVMDNGMMVFYQKKAMDQAFHIQYQKHDDVFLKLTQMFSARPENDEALRSFLQNLANLASSKADAEQWLHHLSDNYEDIHQIKDFPSDIQFNFYEYLFVESKRYEKTLEKISEIFILRYADDIKKHVLVKDKIQALPTLFDTLKQKDYYAFRQTFINIAHVVVPTSPDKEDKEYIRLRKEILSLEDRMISLLFTEEEFVKDIHQLNQFIHKLVEMCNDYRNFYAEYKEKNDMIDFDDMEHFALSILQANDAQVASIYRDKFVEIMVDEFQDSNDVQNTLVNLICKNNNVFRVGDIKQSIYGFRHAKPALMKGLIDHRTSYDEVIYLSNNYRSKKMIVDFNNELFKKLMNTEGFDCSYRSEDDVDTGVPEQLTNNIPICFHAVFHDEIKEEEHLIIAKNVLKANYIAHQIIEIHDIEHRPWKDFVVLVRSNARKDQLKAAFDELQIPYFIDIKYGFYQSSAVQTILSALRCICNPHDDIAFVAWMLSPLFPLHAQDLAEVKIAKDKNESYYSYFQNHPFSEFMQVEELIEFAKQRTLTEMLNALYNVNDYYSKFTSIQEKTNLDLLFEKAVQFEKDTAGGMEAFLSQVEQIKDAQTAEAIPVGSDADVVRVMSIHQSKGLQFPVVFLWSTDKQTPVEFKELGICDSDLGIAVKAMDLPQRYVRTTIPRIAMEHKKDKEELEEEMRILYVATTRAQQQMHIVDCVLSLQDYAKPLTMPDIYARNGYTSWILQTFLTQPSPLFTIKEVHHLWKSRKIKTITSEPQEIPYYQHEKKSWKLSTASSKEATELPEFTWETTKRGTQYGTYIHKMIEQIRNRKLDDVQLREIASMINFEIHEYDIEKLHRLYENPIYQEAMRGRCYYELPYTVQDHKELLHGFIDFVSMDESQIYIIDFKSDALNEDIDFINRYQEQLKTYQKAMHILYPNHSIHIYIYSLHMNHMIAL